MPGILAMGTTYNSPNYVGELFELTPTETPFLSAIGGLTGGKSVNATQWEWQTTDLRDPSAERQRLEGAAPPTAENRVRANVRNVLEIHQEQASVSYTKQAAVGQVAVPSQVGVPGFGSAGNPIVNELSTQLMYAINSIALDVEVTFLKGNYNLPSDNTTVRKTRGLLPAIQTNRTDLSLLAYTGFTSATDTITGTHALANGDKVIFDAVGAATGLRVDRVYFVVNVSGTASFKVSATLGGAPITVGVATGINLHKPQTTALTVANVNDIIQLAWDNGSLSLDTSVLMINSTQKRNITTAYQTLYGNANYLGSANRQVGGVSVDTVLTDFGTIGVMLNRHMPKDAIAVVSLDQCSPVFLDIPGKGHFFQEAMAKTKASDEVQIYGEIGLEYGNELKHALVQGLPV